MSAGKTVWIASITRKEIAMVLKKEPTSALTEIRAFLRSSGVQVKPWEPPQAAIEALYTTLKERSDDGVFYSNLRILASNLNKTYFNPEPLPGAHVLGDATVGQLIDDLQADLKKGGTEGGIRQWLSKPIRATSIAGFLLLGFVTACEDGTQVELTEEEIAMCEDDGIPEDECAVYVDLVEIVQSADIDNSTLQDILACLPELDAELQKAKA